ncbi:MAG: NapC/NirT family cytochrome c [Rhodoplanes sp.]|uniref:NapC/NirT family cytochrome c n=1 Tax=Rhodoplanes sp. TaxID=1968906 RepID=UPI001856299A|nr:NapC/NirT family cytochrome c [Rhodoplanes sp.]NVO12424.1 NapC/NirT family cytochrome c [Rhodoplanes sp.]
MSQSTPEPGGPGRIRRLWGWLMSPSARWPLAALVAAGFVGGVLFWGAFHTAVEASSTLEFCTGCHVMRDFVYKEYATTIHYQNRTGVKAACADCHVPKEWLPKMLRKVQATNELWHWMLGTIDTKEKFEAKRLELATHVWDRMKRTDSLECRNCHTLQSMNPEFQKPRARKVHLDAFTSGQTCIDCHKGIAHHSPRDQLTAAQIEALEKPDPAFVRPIPATFMEGLARVTAREAEEAKAREEETRAAEQALRARIQAEILRAGAADPGKASAAAGAIDTFGVDWAAIPPKTVTLFYPGVSSFEWVQVTKDHSGARGFLRAGERCAECHGKEVKEIGAKIVSGAKNEPTPIPGKRPWIDVAVQAAQDGKTLFLRFEWSDTPHTPAPFVDGGKMDPQNPSKLSMMIAGKSVDRGEQAGCWVTCHHDARSMPDARKVDAKAANGLMPNATDAALTDGLTKYLAQSRTAVDLQGKDGARGGGIAVKPADELAALRAAGTRMELLRVRPGHPAESGSVLAQRLMDGGLPISGSIDRIGDRWIATIRRPLAAERPGDISLVPGEVYTVGFAVHDDFADARFHHVSLDLRLALDDPASEIPVAKIAATAQK